MESQAYKDKTAAAKAAFAKAYKMASQAQVSKIHYNDPRASQVRAVQNGTNKDGTPRTRYYVPREWVL